MAVKGERVSSPLAQPTRSLAGRSVDTDHRPQRPVRGPGLIDNHAHYMEEGVLWTDELRLDGIETRKQAIEMMRAKAASLSPGRWVYTLGGWSPDQFTDDKRSSRVRSSTRSVDASGAPAVHEGRDVCEQPCD